MSFSFILIFIRKAKQDDKNLVFTSISDTSFTHEKVNISITRNSDYFQIVWLTEYALRKIELFVLNKN